ncbi:MAG: hypothetical protein IT532_04700 [Burkholderiales bacterium]|nr:hypothetical protein [Burkholderiales bacterium]
MKSSLGYARVALLCASAMLLSSSYAASRCTTGVRVLVLTQSQTEHSATVIARTCRSDCAQSTAEASGQAVPPHLPVLAEPEDVAEWHAQIYERLSASREAPETLQYCKADANLL